MKRYLYKTICLIIIMPFAGCLDLNEEPKALLSSNGFYESLDALQVGVNGVYSSFLYGTDEAAQFRFIGSARMYAALTGGDDLTTLAGGSKEEWRQFDQFTKDGNNSAVLWSSWMMPYAVIRAANTVLESATNVEASQEQVDELLAEVHFLRGWSYFWLVRVFGEVPLVTSTEIDPEIGLSPVQDIYELIIDDFTFAEINLPETQDRNSKPSKYAAKAFLAKVYLTMGGWPLKQTDKYALARDKALEVMNSGLYDLYPDIKTLWDLANEGDNEFIFGFEFCSLSDCGDNRFTSTFGSAPAKPASFLPNSQRRFSDYFIEINFFKNFPEGPRKDAYFLTEVKQPNGSILTWENFNTRHPHLSKFYEGSVPGTPTWEGHPVLTSRNRQLMRYAEVLLIYAEAQAMAGAPDASAYEAINMVKRRAMGLDPDMPDASVDLTPGLSATAFQEAVLDERGWELVGELKRWFDLTRLEKVAEANANKDPRDLPILGSMDPDNYYAPIPVEEVLRNPKLGGN